MYWASNGAITNVVHHILDLHFQGQTFLNVNISKAMRVSEKGSRMNYIDGDICHRMGPLQMLYSVIFKFKPEWHKFHFFLLHRDLNFQGQTFQVAIFTWQEKTLKNHRFVHHYFSDSNEILRLCCT